MGAQGFKDMGRIEVVFLDCSGVGCVLLKVISFDCATLSLSLSLDISFFLSFYSKHRLCVSVSHTCGSTLPAIGL